MLYCFDLLKSERIVFSVGRSLWSEGLDKTGVLYNFLIPQHGSWKNTNFWQIGEVGQNALIFRLKVELSTKFEARLSCIQFIRYNWQIIFSQADSAQATLYFLTRQPHSDRTTICRGTHLNATIGDLPAMPMTD